MAQWNETTQSWGYAPGELEAQVEVALAAETGEGGTEALHIRYVQAEAGYRINLSNGVTIGFPARIVEGLEGRGAIELRSVHILPDGDTVEWSRLDLHLSLSRLMAGSFGNLAWNQQLAAQARKEAAAHAGRAKSPRKATSSAANGKKGGRPKKVSTQQESTRAKTPRRIKEGA